MMDLISEDGVEIVNARAHQVGVHLEGMVDEVAAISAWDSVVKMKWSQVRDDFDRYLKTVGKKLSVLFLVRPDGHFWSTAGTERWRT